MPGQPILGDVAFSTLECNPGWWPLSRASSLLRIARTNYLYFLLACKKQATFCGQKAEVGRTKVFQESCLLIPAADLWDQARWPTLLSAPGLRALPRHGTLGKKKAEEICVCPSVSPGSKRHHKTSQDDKDKWARMELDLGDSMKNFHPVPRGHRCVSLDKPVTAGHPECHTLHPPLGTKEDTASQVWIVLTLKVYTQKHVGWGAGSYQTHWPSEAGTSMVKKK